MFRVPINTIRRKGSIENIGLSRKDKSFVKLTTVVKNMGQLLPSETTRGSIMACGEEIRKSMNQSSHSFQFQIIDVILCLYFQIWHSFTFSQS